MAELPVHVEAEVRRILRAEARRLLAEGDGQPTRPATRPDRDALDDRTDQLAPRVEADPFPDHATLELAIDGIAAHPFVVNGQRVPAGKPSQRHDRLGIALGGGEEVEKFARLGYAARKAGWTPEGGWPT